MKVLITLPILLITLSSLAQPFFEMGLTNNGAHMAAGVITPQGGGISIGYHVPITKTTVPNVYYAAGMYQFDLSHNDQDNFTATATLGIALHNYTDAGKYQGYTNTTGAAYGLELAKDWYMGRLYISANYMSRMYVGAGMKFMFR